MRTGHRATTLPGAIALRVAPRLPAELGDGIASKILITGTNGKTTTAALLAAILKQFGRSLAHNRGGANLPSGITTALIEAVTRKPACEAAVLEVDEAAFAAVCSTLRPHLALVTNFFRDQLDRYGEPSTTVALVRRGLQALPEASIAVLNADDPLVASLGPVMGLRAVWFGFEPSGPVATTPDDSPSDVTRCPCCQAPLHYHHRFYAHLGWYVCPSCGFGRPVPQVSVQRAPTGSQQSLRLRVTTPRGAALVHVPSRGLHNAYNAAAALAAAYTCSIPLHQAASAVSNEEPEFGRMRWTAAYGRRLCVGLVKNPVGLGQVMQIVVEDPSPDKAVVLFLADRAADGRDVSWIWDADLSMVTAAQGSFRRIVVSGQRALEMGLRLKYGGVETDRISVQRDLLQAIGLATRSVPPGAPIYLLPTYSALLALQSILARVPRGEAVGPWRTSASRF